MTDRAEWLEWRRGGITATDVAALMGFSNFGSPWTVYSDKVGLLPPSDEDPNEYAAFGRVVEDHLLTEFEQATGLFALNRQAWAQHPDEPWMRATPDAQGYESPEGTEPVCGVECKTTGDSVKAWQEDGVPLPYQAQCQWQMAVLGVNVIYLPTLHVLSRKFWLHEVHRDEADIAHLVRAARSLWFDHVLTGIPPETDGSDATTAALNAAYPGDDELKLTATPDLAKLVQRLADAKADRKAAEEREEELSNAIKAAMQDATALVAEDGTELATWRSQTVAAHWRAESTRKPLTLKSPKKERNP